MRQACYHDGSAGSESERRTGVSAATAGSRLRRWASPAVAVAVLAVVIWRLGTGPFLAGLKAVDSRAVLAAAAVVLVTTLCSAWRWTIVARGLGVRLSLAAAVAAYYRALFLNLTLPGGVAGDVHRGVSHGRDVRDVGRDMRDVVWERAAGQAVQTVLTISVLLVLPSPVRSSMPFVAGAAIGIAVGVILVCRKRVASEGSRWTRVRAAVVTDIRDGVLRSQRVAGCRARLGRGRRRPCGHFPHCRTGGGRDGVDLPAATAGAARVACDGPAECRRLGTARGTDLMGVRRGRARCRSRRCNRRHLWSLGAGRRPTGRSRARRRAASSTACYESQRAEAGPDRSDRGLTPVLSPGRVPEMQEEGLSEIVCRRIGWDVASLANRGNCK